MQKKKHKYSSPAVKLMIKQTEDPNVLESVYEYLGKNAFYFVKLYKSNNYYEIRDAYTKQIIKLGYANNFPALLKKAKSALIEVGVQFEKRKTNNEKK
jgi:hypothetical protein